MITKSVPSPLVKIISDIVQSDERTIYFESKLNEIASKLENWCVKRMDSMDHFNLCPEGEHLGILCPPSELEDKAIEEINALLATVKLDIAK